MADKIIQMQVRNEANTAWDNLNPKTKANAVLMENGKSVEESVSTHLADYTKHVSKDGTLQTSLNADLLDGNHASAFATASHTHSTYLPKSGGTMTGILTAQNNTSYTTKQVRNITLSTSNPSGGSNGDIWIKYV